METVTLEQIHDDLVGIKKEISYLQELVDEEYAPSDTVVSEIQASKKRRTSEFISQDAMRKEFCQ